MLEGFDNLATVASIAIYDLREPLRLVLTTDPGSLLDARDRLDSDYAGDLPTFLEAMAAVHRHDQQLAAQLLCTWQRMDGTARYALAESDHRHSESRQCSGQAFTVTFPVPDPASPEEKLALLVQMAEEFLPMTTRSNRARTLAAAAAKAANWAIATASPALARRIERAGQAAGRQWLLLDLTVQLAGQNGPLDSIDSLRQAQDGFEASGLPGAAALTRAFIAANCGDSYTAGFALAKWVFADEPTRLFFTPPPTSFGRDRWPIERPRWELIASPHPDSTERKTVLLELMLDCCGRCESVHPSFTRMWEATALALAQVTGRANQPDRARESVERVFAATGWQHLESAAAALRLLAEGKPVPPYLQKFAGGSNQWLEDRTCRFPFVRADVNNDGNVLVCCGHWLPTAIGNVFNASMEDIVNSPVASDIRRSVQDGSFRYCNHSACQAMVTQSLPVKSAADIPEDELTSLRITGPQEMVFSLDRSCNLSCPSCRTGLHVEKGEEADRLMRATESTILPMLPKLRKLQINAAGEVFLSRSSRRVLEWISRERCPDLTLNIISNGMLFNEAQWNTFPNIHGMIGYVRVSVDGATRETVERLRRGAEFDRLMANLEFISSLRQGGYIGGYYLSFTYQRDNFREMPAFVALAQRLSCEGVLFERLMNMGAFTDEEYKSKAVHLPDHPLYGEFCAILADPCMRLPIIQGDVPGYFLEAANGPAV